MNDDDLNKLRADYAWKWFDLHAKQRMTLFNYFLIIAGIFANAILLSLKDDAGKSQPKFEPSVVHNIVAQATTAPTTFPAAVTITQTVSNTPLATTSAQQQQDSGRAMKILRRGIGGLGVFASIAFIFFDIRSRSLTERAEDVLEQLEYELMFPDGYKLTADGSNRQLGILRSERNDSMRERQKRSLRQEARKMKWWIWILEGLVGIGFFISVLL